MRLSLEHRRTRLVSETEGIVPIGVAPLDPLSQTSVPPISDTSSIVTEMVEDARRAAFDEGRAAGISEATDSAEHQRLRSLQELANAVDAAVKAARTERTAVVAEVASDVAALAVDLTEILIDRVIEDKEALRGTIVRAMRLAPEGDDVVIKLGQENPLRDDEVVALAPIAGARVLRDPSLDAIGCTVEVGACHIEAQRSSALSRVRKELEDAMVTAARGER